MSILQVANIHLESTQNNRIQYLGSNNAALVVAGANAITVNSTVVAVTSNGSINIPIGTTAQRPTAAAGMIRYNSTLGRFEGYTTVWTSVGGAVGGGTDDAFYENTTTITTDYTITTGKNAFSAGPITINSSINVTIPAGSTWTIS